MSIILNGTTGITSTGITETADGNVGIGTSSPSVSVSGVGLHLSDTSANTGIRLQDTSFANKDFTIRLDATDNALAIYHENSASEKMRIDSSGKVGIGTSSPTAKLSIYGSQIGDVPLAITHAWGSSSTPLITASNGSSEVMRLERSGNLLVGTTNTGHTSKLGIQNTGGTDFGIVIRNANALSNAAITFVNNSGTRVGTISYTTSATTYSTSSDYRLKEDWVAVADASTRVNALKPVNFAWKVDGSRVDGFLAHELAEIVPEAVTGEKDAVELVDIKDEDGNVTGQEERPVYQGIDQSKLVPLLTAALQEALAKIEDLTARVVALEGQP